MTYEEYFKFKGFKTKDDIKLVFGGWWSDHFIDKIFGNVESNLMNSSITNYEVFCEYPFWKLNRIYNDYYSKNGEIGSTYDWLSETATDDIVEQYLGREND